MAARKIQANEVAKSINDLIRALGDDVLPTVEELRKKGYVTSEDYGRAVGRSARTVKIYLDKSDAVDKKVARTANGRVSMYKVK